MGRKHNGNSEHETRKGRKAIAEETMAILENGGYYLNKRKPFVSVAEELQEAMANTVLYEPSATDLMLLQERKQPTATATAKETTTPSTKQSTTPTTEFHVWNRTTLDSVRWLASQDTVCANDILCLNFASARNPGGGFLNGSQAQEESIARASGLFPCLSQGSSSGYYAANRAAGAPFYTDAMIYSPRVPVFRQEDGKLMEQPLLVSFVTAPAVNASVCHSRNAGKQPKQRDDMEANEVEAVMRRRISKILAIAHHHGHETLVLGAWGCGVFANDPVDVAKWFRMELDMFHHSFRRVVFAIYSPSSERFIAPFQWEFARKEDDEEEDTQEGTALAAMAPPRDA